VSTVTLLLPARTRLGAPPPPLAAILGRADLDLAQAGEAAQLRRQFQLAPPWPVAALTRQLDAGDAGDSLWLRADPAFIQPEQSGARLLAWGGMLQPDARDVAELLPALQPLFAEYGLTLDAPVPERWYLRVPHGLVLPEFSAADAALGEDVFVHLPMGDAGRVWRALLTESQILLHQHPWNARRRMQGHSPINSLWFWGAGRLPHPIETAHTEVHSRDALLLALAHATGAGQGGALAQTHDDQPVTGSVLIDLRHLRAIGLLADEVLPPLTAALAQRTLGQLRLDCADGAQYLLTARQRWRFWKRPAQWPLVPSNA